MVLLASLLVGCSKNQQEPTTTSEREVTPKGPGAAVIASPEVFQAASPALNESPDGVVNAFLAALRDGDESLAESLLTAKAREETAKQGLAVHPPGTPSASFQLGETDYVTSDKRGAHVSCTWTEQDGQDDAISYEIVWALRRQVEGWRIAGMATQVTEGGPPVFLNFEDPLEMIDKWHNAEAELAAETKNEGVRQATRPEAAASGVPR